MFNHSTKVKLLITFGLVLVYCINCFAAIVSDNDGSAFITKSEFESLKRSFNKQINDYNESIDGKIDGAIASYLAGITLTTKTELQLDSSTKYVFPLRYDTSEAWNNPDGPWFNLMHPQIYKKEIEFSTYLGADSVTYRGWFINYGTEGIGAIPLSTPSVLQADKYKWGVHQTQYYNLDYKGKIGTYAHVEKTGNTRIINLGSGNQNYKIYKRNVIGHGKQLISYIDQFKEALMTNSSNHYVWNQTTPHPYTYWQMAFCNANIKNQTISADGTNWTRNCFESHQAGFKGALAVIYQLGERYSLKGIKDKSPQVPNDPFSNDRSIVDDTTVVGSEANDFQDNNVQYIFGRGSTMPANLMGYWNLKPKIYSDTTKVQYTVVLGSELKLEKQFGWSLTEDQKTIAFLIRTYPTFLPTMIASDNTKYDSSDTDDFSKLPSTLVTYEDSKGNTHYYDEGMFLGYYEKKGDVGFTVKFQKDSGSGTKVKLHISKKPFSYNFNNSDLLEYKINNVSGKEQQLTYGTSYNITIPAIEKNECLYMEWVPVTSGDLAALTSFDDYHIMIEN